MEIVGQHFRPEFVNRIDEPVVFRPLSRDNIRKICAIQVNQLAKRLNNRGLSLDITDAALDKIGDAGFDPVYGARPLKRAIQELLENPLAENILRGDYTVNTIIHVDLSGDELVFSKREPEEQVA